ncbi:GNAT family N-acetyltransferase [Bhargavaea beijingensis]|uniref:GNAT family N-acetyltransferase n=1 Tax=Bhargavaea beijingensis TaxID=426756 RepID=A0ABX9ZCF8_9BACL|nr:GNAT family N-acetyltransferase [Bhargavaea beijingensis]MCW1929369.1 GNAT family N-acetyltransferase [Bhargavaea beijingensis]RSK31000.1 GNAT family N-acetyltransferase [Bhargavaea beijingensis]
MTEGNQIFRSAVRADLEGIVGMLADDHLGRTRENPDLPLERSYEEAFLAISQDPNNELIVAERNGNLAGVLQLTFLPSLTYRGSWRAMIEGVRVAASMRGSGVGGGLIRHAIGLAEEKGCRLVQLTTDKGRPDAVRFYESLGFCTTHEGMKLRLDKGDGIE